MPSPIGHGLMGVALMILACLLAHIVLDVLNEDTREPYGVAVLWPLSEHTLYYNIGLLPRIEKYTYADLVSRHNFGVAVREFLVLGALVTAVLAVRLGLGLLRGRKAIGASAREAA